MKFARDHHPQYQLAHLTHDFNQSTSHMRRTSSRKRVDIGSDCIRNMTLKTSREIFTSGLSYLPHMKRKVIFFLE